MDKQNFPTIATPRLKLRRLEPSDCREISFLRTDPEVNRWVQRSRAETQDKALAFIEKINRGFQENNMYYWCICLVPQKEMLGSICLWNFSEDRTIAETGYDLHPEFQGKGIMQEAMRAVLNFGFEHLALENILAYTHRENIPSRKLLERNRFQVRTDLVDAHQAHNVIYELLKNNFSK